VQNVELAGPLSLQHQAIPDVSFNERDPNIGEWQLKGLARSFACTSLRPNPETGRRDQEVTAGCTIPVDVISIGVWHIESQRTTVLRVEGISSMADVPGPRIEIKTSEVQ
jgi:hypothetical protein